MVKNSPKTAMLFAAGFGKRMLPITETTPKPLVKVAGKPLIDYGISTLKQAGVKNIVVNTHHLSDKIATYIKNLNDNSIIISHEKEILETGGGIVNALPLLGDEPIFTLNSDIILMSDKEPALKSLCDLWDPKKMDALMLVVPLAKTVGYDGNGDFNLTKDGRIIKPNAKSFDYVFTGAMIIKTSIFKTVAKKPFSVFKDFLYKNNLQEDGSLKNVYGTIHNQKWLHIGTKEGINLAETALNAN